MDTHSPWLWPLLAAFLAPLASGQGFPTRDYGMGTAASMSALVDLDNDGIADLTTAVDTGHVAVRLGLANAEFGALSAYAAQPGTRVVVFGDVNSDGNPDAVAGNGGASNSVSILTSNGTGSLTAAGTYSTVGKPNGIALADFDLDGALDFAVAVELGSIPIFVNLGAQGFASLTWLNGGQEPRAVIAGDWNVDGVADLASCDAGGHSILTWLGNGNATFQSPSSVSVTAVPTSLVTRDLDNDGSPDLAVAGVVGGWQRKIVLAGGLGTGFFVVSTDFVIDVDPASLVCEDLDFDGFLDFVVPAYDRIAVYRGAAGLTWSAAPVVHAGTRPTHAILGDVNGDGRYDLLTTNYGSVTVTFGNAAGGFDGYEVKELAEGPRAVLLRDFDLDGTLDVVTASDDSNSIQWARGGAGGFGPLTTAAVSTKPVSLTVADFDADGDLDAAAAGDVNNAIAVWLGSPAGLTGSAVTYAALQNASWIGAADMNLDGKLDLATLHDTANQAAWTRGNGTGTFGVVKTFTSLPFPIHGLAADVDGDGDPDLVVASYFPGGGLAIQTNDGLGNLSTPNSVTAAPCYSVARGDVDGDGVPDLAATTPTAGLQLFPGQGGGLFAQGGTVAVKPFTRRVIIGDVNTDGLPDLVVAGWDSGESTCSILTSLGAGAFAPAIEIGLPFEAEDVDMGDLDSDGDADLALVAGGGASLVVLRNAPLAFSGSQAYGAGTSGAHGRLGLRASAPVVVNSPNFGIGATNAPRASLGLGLVTDSQDLTGSDPFQIGVAMHVDFVAATEILAFDVNSDAGGSAFVKAPIPNLPALSGRTYYAQLLFVEAFGERVSPSPFGLVSSRGLTIAIP